MKKRGLVLLVAIMMLLCMVGCACAESQTLSTDCRNILEYKFYDGTKKITYAKVGKKVCDVTLTVVGGKYTGGNTQQKKFDVKQSAAEKAFAKTPTGVVRPSSGWSFDVVSNSNGKKIKVTTRGGQFTIISKSVKNVSVGGEETWGTDTTASTFDFSFVKTFTRK